MTALNIILDEDTAKLFSDYVPRTVENFLGYCNGKDAAGKTLVDPDGLYAA